jgi:hypothetical protein
LTGRPDASATSPDFGQHLSGLDADSALNAEVADSRTDLEGGANRTLGVVFMRDRDSERRHDGVAGKGFDRAAVGLDPVLDELEELRHATARNLGIRAGDECR